MSAGKDGKIFGGLGSISLHDLIQLLGMNRSTTTLVLRRQGHEGRIYFKSGNVVHAFTGEIEGPDAFAELLKWQDADFVIEEGIPSLPRVTISESAVGLMLSSMTRLDEDARDAPATAPAPGPASRGTPPKPPTSGRFTPQARPPVRGTVISVPDEATTRLPLLPILGVALALAAAGATWWVLGSRSEVSGTAGGTTTSRTAPTPATTPNGPPEQPSALEATATDVATEPAEAIETPPPEPAPTPVPDGVLDATVPSGAELRIDGQRVPPGPRRVSPGRHTIEVIRPDVRGIQLETVEVGAGQTLRRTFTADQYGWLQVVVIPWAEVFVDGESVGQTPMPRIKVAVGEHTVVLRHPEVEERRQTVAVREGETTLVRVTLQGVSG